MPLFAKQVACIHVGKANKGWGDNAPNWLFPVEDIQLLARVPYFARTNNNPQVEDPFCVMQVWKVTPEVYILLNNARADICLPVWELMKGAA